VRKGRTQTAATALPTLIKRMWAGVGKQVACSSWACREYNAPMQEKMRGCAPHNMCHSTSTIRAVLVMEPRPGHARKISSFVCTCRQYRCCCVALWPGNGMMEGGGIRSVTMRSACAPGVGRTALTGPAPSSHSGTRSVHHSSG